MTTDVAGAGTARRAAATPDAIRQRLRAERDASIERFRAERRIEPLLRALTASADRALVALWKHAGFDAGFALLAVGGYGRGELQPHSDIDVLVLAPGTLTAAESGRIEAFVGHCWDVGLEVGQAVRTVAQCGEQALADITVMTSLVERRRLAGPVALCAQLDAEIARVLDPGDFLRHKRLEMQQRHHRYEDTPYSLEPNVKESPGGLRDLHLINWISIAAGLGRNWTELLRAGFVEPQELAQLRRCDTQLKTIRAWLHILSRRREDRLLFDLQPAVATAMGFGADGARAQSEALMQRYYLAAKAVTQLVTLLLQAFELRLLGGRNLMVEPIDADFCRIGNLLDLRDPDGFVRDHRLVLRTFLLLQATPGLDGMTSRTLRSLWRATAGLGAEFRRDPVNRANFLRILQAPRGVTHALRRMNQWSVLGRYLPVFRRIVGRMQHDLFHVYTVDQHILMVVRNLRRFMFPEHAHEYPLCSELIVQFERNWLLIVAALFHDIAKGRGGDHSQLGAIEAARFCRQHGLDAGDTALVVFLVREHLTMSMTAQKTDISDPDTIAAFAARVGDERRLTALYLLTVADIRGTSAKVWNGWKGKLLEDLYRRTRSHLAGQTLPSRQTLIRVQDEAARLLLLRGLEPARYQAFWNTLDLPYFLRHEPEDIAWHTRVLCAGAAGGGTGPHGTPGPHGTSTTTGASTATGVPAAPVARTRISPLGIGFELLVYTDDQPALFARICRYIDRMGLSILQAWIHTTRAGKALDTFIITDPRGETNYRDILSLVETELGARLREPIDVASLQPAGPVRLARRSRAFPIAPRVELRPDETARHFLLTVHSMDRSGLLYDVARELAQAGIDLRGARIVTLGERVEDLFTLDGANLHTARARVALERRLLAVL